MENIDFEISQRRRLVWATELELFGAFCDICNRHNLKYYADGGTLLGTVRHNGFIPWDDDLDVSMLREDYEKFISYAKIELPKDYYLQIPEPNNDYFYGHAKIRKNNTTAIRYVQYAENYQHHQGVFIDIFPLDNIPDNPIWQKIHRFISVKLMQIMYYSKYYYRVYEHTTITRIKHRIAQLMLPSDKCLYRFYKVYESWIKIPNKKKTKEIGTTSIFYYIDGCSWAREWFADTDTLEFESLPMSVPRHYREVLSKTFGDYMTPIKAPSEHGEVYFDLQNDYSLYYKGGMTFSKEDCQL